MLNQEQCEHRIDERSELGTISSSNVKTGSTQNKSWNGEILIHARIIVCISRCFCKQEPELISSNIMEKTGILFQPFTR